MSFRVIFVMLLLATSAFAAPKKDDCLKWFRASKLKPGTGCLTKCASLPVGMGTFACASRCREFCKEQPVMDKVLGKLLYYPGLTAEERKLIEQYPRQAITVFKQKQKAESATQRVFGRDDQGDESDAFRHFVWAGFLAKELGADMAKNFLDAHEDIKGTDDSDRAMDLANNRAGLLSAERLLREKNLTDVEIEKEALSALQAKTLSVLKPKGGAK